jgi:HPt (histidine-containing phosphotransfer) domain-containing protein
LAKPIEKDALYETMDFLTGSSEEDTRGSTATRSQNPVFDLGAALDSLDGDTELLREIVGISMTQFPKHMEKIREGISARNPKILEHAAHSLKGTGANLLAQGVMEAASRLEEIGRAGSVAGSKEALVKLEEELTKLQVALREFEKEYATSSRGCGRRLVLSARKKHRKVFHFQRSRG